MKRLITFLFVYFALCAPALAQFAGPVTANGIALSTRGQLPTGGVNVGAVRWVTDTNGSSCTVAGATTLLCRWSGSAWVPGGAGSITTTGGDVFGPASSTAGHLATFSNTTGKLLSDPGTIAILSSGLTIPTASLAGRTTAGTGAIEAITMGAGLSMGSGVLSVPNSGITAAMLAGSIPFSKLIGTDITAVGTIATGIWHGSIIDGTYGGLGINAAGFNGVIRMINGVASVIPGSSTDCIFVSGASGACPTGPGGTGLSGLTPTFLLTSVTPTTATTSALFKELGGIAYVGNFGGSRSLEFSLAGAPSGLSSVVLPPSTTPVIVGGIAAPGDSNCVLYISLAGMQVRGACGGGGGGGVTVAGSGTEHQYRLNSGALGAIAGTSSDGSHAIYASGVLQATMPSFNGVLGATGLTMHDYVTVASANAGFRFTPGTTASPTVILSAYGTPTDLNMQVSGQGAGILCLAGPCPPGQSPGIWYLNTLIIDGTTSGHISLKGAADSGTYTVRWPITRGAAGQMLLASGDDAVPWTWGTPSGSGTVTNFAFTGGILSVANPTGSVAVTITGTSGGVPYFTDGTHWASSGTLTAGNPVLGGGAGNPPTVGSRSGTTTKYATVGATQVENMVATFDSGGNVISSGYTVGAGIGDVSAAANFGVSGALLVADGTLKGVKASGIIIDAFNNMTIPGRLALGGVVNPCDGSAACIYFGQGIAPSGLGAAGVSIYAPASVTPYALILPGAGPAGNRLIQASAAGVLSFVNGLSSTISVRKGDDSGPCNVVVLVGMVTSTTC